MCSVPVVLLSPDSSTTESAEEMESEIVRNNDIEITAEDTPVSVESSGTAKNEATSRALPTKTARPTNTAVPTNTVEPTDTVEPTSTLRPTATVVASSPTAIPATAVPTQVPEPTEPPVPTVQPAPTEPPIPTVPPAGSSSDVAITGIRANGDINPNEPDEYAIITNRGGGVVNLSGWRLNAGDDGQDFYFPGFELGPGMSCRVYTNENHPEYCGFSFGRGDAIWRNSGDCGYLFEANGAEVSRYCY